MAEVEGNAIVSICSVAVSIANAVMESDEGTCIHIASDSILGDTFLWDVGLGDTFSRKSANAFINV